MDFQRNSKFPSSVAYISWYLYAPKSLPLIRLVLIVLGYQCTKCLMAAILKIMSKFFVCSALPKETFFSSKEVMDETNMMWRRRFCALQDWLLLLPWREKCTKMHCLNLAWVQGWGWFAIEIQWGNAFTFLSTYYLGIFCRTWFHLWSHLQVTVVYLRAIF